MRTFKYILFVFIFTSCITEWDRYLDTDVLDYEILSASELFKESSVLYVEKYNNDLTIRIKIKPLVKSDSLQKTQIFKNLYFIFYNENNEIIKIDSVFSYNTYNKTDLINNELSCKSILFNLHKTNEVTVTIPLIYFYTLQKGNNIVKLKVYTKNHAVIKSKNDYNNKIIIKNKLDYLSNIQFKLDMPQVYETVLCNDSIILQNNNEFSPKGMDISLREGLPDIYWRLNYEEDNYFFNFHSKYEATYDVKYLFKDTVSFYHIEDVPTIKISVMDRDDLSPDDIIGIWEGNINELKGSKDNYKNIEFSHIDKFRVKVIKQNFTIN